MKFMSLLLAILGYVVLVKASLNELPVHPGVGGLYKGPNSETIIRGPDGSVITAQQEGGSVVTQDISQPIVVADIVEPAPPLISTVTAAPAVVPIVSAAPIVPAAAVVPNGHTVEIIQPDPHIIETEIVDAPVIEPEQSSDLVGPSGSISIRGSSSIISGPASTTISEPAKIILATPLVAAIPVISTVTTPLRAVPVANTGVRLAITPIVTDNTSPKILVSTVAPPTETVVLNQPSASTLVPPIQIISTTAAPPGVWSSTNDITTNLALGPTPDTVQNIGASVEPASSYGVINNAPSSVSVSSTPQPEVLLSSTLVPPIAATQNIGTASTTPSTNLDFNNRQLNLNPSLIPASNIIPPEIGPLPPGAIDLGTTITVSTTPRNPGLISPTESPNIQRINNENTILQETINNIDGRLELGTNHIAAQNQIVLSANEVTRNLPSRLPLLRDTNTISIPRNGIVGSQLRNYGIDESQIDLTHVPLSSVSPLDREIDEVSAHLWNRYGRHVKDKKTKKGRKET